MFVAKNVPNRKSEQIFALPSSTRSYLERTNRLRPETNCNSHLLRAIALTSSAVRGRPPIPQSPPSISLTTTWVTDRICSPSTDTTASVTFLIISCFWFREKTSLITLISTKGITRSSLRYIFTAVYYTRLTQPIDLTTSGADPRYHWLLLPGIYFLISRFTFFA